MSRHLISIVVFLAGLAAVCWVGIGYVAYHFISKWW